MLDAPPATDGAPVLWHLKPSPYNEKARWALDYKGVAHNRRAATPGRQHAIAEKLTGGSTLPVLVLDGEAIGDSTQIIEEIERRWPEPPLYPSDPSERRRALELEDFFDEELGPYVRLLLVAHVVSDPDATLGMFFPDLHGMRRGAARAMFPLLRQRFVATFRIDEDSVAAAREKVRKAAERFRAELGGREYLVGDRFTVADLTAAALVAPAIGPEQFPYPQPQGRCPAVDPVREVIAESGLADWAREIYARHRGTSAEILAA